MRHITSKLLGGDIHANYSRARRRAFSYLSVMESRGGDDIGPMDILRNCKSTVPGETTELPEAKCYLAARLTSLKLYTHASFDLDNITAILIRPQGQRCMSGR